MDGGATQAGPASWPPRPVILRGIDAIRRATGRPAEATVELWRRFLDCPIYQTSDGELCADEARLLRWVKTHRESVKAEGRRRW